MSAGVLSVLLQIADGEGDIEVSALRAHGAVVEALDYLELARWALTQNKTTQAEAVNALSHAIARLEGAK